MSELKDIDKREVDQRNEHAFVSNHGEEEETDASRPLNRWTVIIGLWGMLASVGYGYGSGVIAGTLGLPSFRNYFTLDTRPNAAGVTGAMLGLSYAGGFFGLFIHSMVSDRWGRKAGLAFGNIVMVFGGILCTAAVTTPMLIVGRFFIGFSAFSLVMAAMLWLGEISPKEHRGVIAGLSAWGQAWGFTISNFVGVGVSHATFKDSWRLSMGLQLLFPIIMLSTLPFVPESPRWLISKGRSEQALESLKKVHQNAVDPEDTRARRELFQIEKQVALDKSLVATWFSMFFHKSYRKRTLMAFGVFAASQVTGVLVINNYATQLYAGMGFDYYQQELLSAGSVATSMFGNLVGMFLVDKWGRVRFMIAGSLACSVALALEAGLIAQYTTGNNLAAKRAAAFGIFLFQALYTTLIDTAAFVYVAELFPSHIRSKGVAIGVSAITLVDLTFTQAAPTAFANIGWRYYLVFIALSVTAAILMLLYCPETRGLQMEEIARLFDHQDEVAIFAKDVHISDIEILHDGPAGHEVEKSNSP